MIILKLKYENLNIYIEEILKLLIESYMVNFDLNLEECAELSKKKLDILCDYIKNEKAYLLIACEGDKLYGFVWLHKHIFFGEERLHVNQIVVNYQYRGKGIAKKLIAEAENLAIQENIKAIDLFVSESNSDALSMYYKLGFETERRYMKKKL